MFKHKNLMMMMKLMKICCAAVLALGLAACGSKTVAPVITPATPPAVAEVPDPSIEAAKLSEAQEAAMTAATDARTAAGDAQEAADTVADLTGNESAQAMAAQDAADAADTAATAAEEASERAQAATMSADAVVEQTTAETEQGTADDQLVMAQELQRESQGEIEALNLSDAKTAAMTAATDARTAASDAQEAADTVADLTGDGSAQAMAAQAVADAADTAATAAEAASERAQAATMSADAVVEQTTAETEQGKADDQLVMAQELQGEIEALNLSDAKTAAMTAATDARTAAGDAQEAADTVADLTGDGSAQAIAAQAVADAADAAATAAEAASERAQAATMSADAVGEQTTAETEQGKADNQLAMAQELERESQVASDAAGQLQQERDLATAQDAAKAASAAALAHFNSADQKSKDARAKAVEARDAADRAVRARTDFVDADKQATAAETAATEAEMARADAWTAVGTADDASMSAMDATTLTDAQMYQEAAETAKATAEEQAEGAGMNYMTAMDAAAAAETAADTHVLGLFTSANAYGETDEEKAAAEVASVGAAIARSSKAEAGNGNSGQAGGATATAAWIEDMKDDPDTDDDEAVPGLLKITFDSMVTEGTGMITSETRADDDTVDPVISNNAKQTNDGGDFPHMFDISSGQARVLVFTDREQDTPEIEAVEAVTITNAVVTVEEITSASESMDGGTSFQGTFDHTDADIPAIKGTFTCTDGPCILVTTGSGDKVMVETATGYTFSGSSEGVTAVQAAATMDYLLFGVWLDEVGGETPGADTFGAIATGGQPFTPANVQALEGKATYRGSAVGAHHKTGSGVSSFDGDAKLTADFDDETAAGTIEGTIDNISVAGGDPMEDSIHLVKTSLVGDQNAFNGAAVMGPQEAPGMPEHTFNGTWWGRFFGIGEDATDHPGSVAGTFGVTDKTGTGDDAVTESYVGAFGAHKQE